jgi:hypothetical protein
MSEDTNTVSKESAGCIVGIAKIVFWIAMATLAVKGCKFYNAEKDNIHAIIEKHAKVK